MNAIQCAKTIVGLITWIEENATEKEFNELQKLSRGDDESLQNIINKLVKMKEKIDERIKTEKYNISITNSFGSIDIKITLNQNMTMKELVSLIEKECRCDIFNAQINYINRAL